MLDDAAKRPTEDGSHTHEQTHTLRHIYTRILANIFVKHLTYQNKNKNIITTKFKQPFKEKIKNYIQ